MKHLLPLLILATALSSCVNHRQLVNFNEEPTLPYGTVEDIINRRQLRIQPDDILHITVDSYNEEAAKPFNRDGGMGMRGGQNMGVGGQGGGLLLTGYLVDSLGRIDFPVLGQVPVSGLTLDEARDLLQGRLYEYLKDAVVNIRFLNFRFTLLGEVGAPGTLTTMNPRITLLEAIGMAGDLTYYADRNRITVVREQNGKREYARLSLKDKNIFESPYFYLQQNDLVYVEPMQARVTSVSDPVFRWVSYGTTAISLVTLVLTLTR